MVEVVSDEHDGLYDLSLRYMFYHVVGRTDEFKLRTKLAPKLDNSASTQTRGPHLYVVSQFKLQGDIYLRGAKVGWVGFVGLLRVYSSICHGG